MVILEYNNIVACAARVFKFLSASECHGMSTWVQSKHHADVSILGSGQYVVRS
jgi:hypothetical protein